jgi:hypothetical protein
MRDFERIVTFLPHYLRVNLASRYNPLTEFHVELFYLRVFFTTDLKLDFIMGLSLLVFSDIVVQDIVNTTFVI